MSKTTPSKSVFSVEEAKEVLASLSDADLVRLRRIAAFFSRGGRIAPDDLLQQAFESVLEGRRNFPRDLDLISFLAGTMKSLASSQFKSIDRSPEGKVSFIQHDDDYEEVGLDCAADVPGADQAMISQQDAEAIQTRILSLFADDEIARLLVEGIMEGMERSELCELTGLDSTSYNSKRRLIRRRINSAKVEGWE